MAIGMDPPPGLCLLISPVGETSSIKEQHHASHHKRHYSSSQLMMKDMRERGLHHRNHLVLSTEPPQASADPATRALFALISTLDHGCALSTLPMQSGRTPPAAMDRTGSRRVDLSIERPGAAHCASSALARRRYSLSCRRLSRNAPTRHSIDGRTPRSRYMQPSGGSSKRTRDTRGASDAAPAHAGGGRSRCRGVRPRLRGASKARDGGAPRTTAPLPVLTRPCMARSGAPRLVSPPRPRNHRRGVRTVLSVRSASNARTYRRRAAASYGSSATTCAHCSRE